MTLLLTCVTSQFAVQASDRRLTFPDGTVAEEVANKATLLCNFAAFAYTGLARCSVVETTDQLLLRSLSEPGVPLVDLVEKLRVEATKAVRQLPLPSVPPEQRRALRRTSFVGCGFVGMRNPAAFGKQPSPDELHPFFAVVSNAQDLSEAWRATADREFTAHLHYPDLSNDSFLLHVAGQPLREAERTDLLRDIRRCLRRVEHPEPVARLLARAVRHVARRNPAVGPNVMCTFVRRSDVKAWNGTITGGPVPIVSEVQNEGAYFQRMEDSQAQWVYSPADPNALVHYGPNFSCDGLQATEFLFGPHSLVGPLVGDASDQ